MDGLSAMTFTRPTFVHMAKGERMKRFKNWRDDLITDKQKMLIDDMMEFSAYPLPKFTGTTKGEASDYIDKYGKLAHEDVNSPTFGY